MKTRPRLMAITALALLAGMAWPRVGVTQTPAPGTAPVATAPATSPMEFRRVFVPADRTADWPTGGAQYLPLARDEFERLVTQAEERRQLEKSGGAQLVEARYAARLTEGELLEGAAEFEVALVEDEPCIVSLEPWNAVLLGGRWIRDAAREETEAATLGLWADDDGTLATYGVQASQSGKLEIDWQAAPERRGDELEFALRLPTAVTQRLTLELPTGFTPTITSGRLIEQAAAASGVGRLWQFQLASGVEHRLTIRRPVEANAAADAAALPLAAVTEAYRLTSDGADYEAELRLQRRGAPLTELRLQAPPTLHVASVTVNREPVEWRRDAEDAATLIVALPTKDDGSQSPVIVAISGAAAVTFDAPWKLPGIAPQNVFWTEGTSTLWVDPTLEIRSLTPRECSLLNVVGVGSGDAGEVYRLQAWSPAASAELVAGAHRQTLRYRSGVAAEFAEREVLATANATIWSEGGRTFHIAAPLGEQWSVESVTAVPSDALAGWHVEEGDIRTLHVQLRRSPTSAMPVTITANARRPWRAWTQMTTVGDLDFLQLPGGAEGRWLMAKDRRGNELVPDAKLAEATVAPADLPLAAQELLGTATPGLAIDLNRASPGGLISVASSSVEFSGEAWMEVSALAAGYEHRAEILCRPTAGGVSELRVLAARELPADVTWELADGTAVVVDRLTPAVNGTASATTSAPAVIAPVEFRVRLPQPRTAPFRLRAAWRSGAPADAAVNLLSLPDAATWQAWAIFRGHPNQVTVDARGATTAVGLPPQASASEMPAIACLRLGDDPSGAIATPPTFVPAASNGGAAATAAAAIQQTGAVAWQCDAATEQLADGTQNHRVHYRIEAREPTEVQLSLSRSGTSFTAVVLDGRTVIAPPTPETRTVRFRLPGSPRLQELTVSLQGKSEPLGRSAKIWPTLPRTSFPVLHGNWTLRWPVAYDATTPMAADVEREVGGVEPADWLARLGGPLAGHGGQRWYDGMLLAHVDAASTGYASSPSGATTPGGWNSLTQAFVDRPAPVSLRLASSEQANWHVSWLMSAVASGWMWARSRRSVVLLVGAVAAVCLVVPERFIPLPQAAFLGLVTGAIVRQCVSFLTKPRGARRSGIRNGATLTASLLGFAVFVAKWSGTAEVACAQAPALPPQVLFPVDGEGKPAGEDVYVPALMAAELLPAASGAPAALVDAHYLVDVQPLAAGGEAVARQVELRFRWQTERPQCRVELPLTRADGAFDPATLLLNGQPAAAVWNDAGTALSVVLPQAGRHELTAKLIPVPAAGSGGRSRLQFHVPRVAGATVEVAHPAGVSDVRLARGTATAGESGAARTLFRLGPEPIVDLTWASRVDREATGVAVEQLSSLEVDPVAARLDVRLRLSGDATGVQALRLGLSPQLKLLPLPEGSPLELAPAAGGDSPGVVELRFRSPPTLPLTLSLQFQVQRTLSVGRIDYPWVDVLGMNVRTRHLVVVADPRLRVRDAVAAGMTAVAASELETTWGAAAADASLRYAVTTLTPAWTLDVTPLPTRFTSRESLELRCGDEEIEFVYSAAIADVEGELLAHRFTLPADLIVDCVTATVEGAAGEVPVRWARPQGNQLQLFLSRPLSEAHLVRIEGRVNAAITATTAAAVDAGLTPAVERHLEVPRIGIEVAAATPIHLLLFRSSDVLVDWASPAPAAKPAAGPPDPTAGLFVGQYSLPRDDGAIAELRIVPNSARYEADALLTMQLDAVQPTATCRIEGRVTAGTVDRLRLLVGKNWRGPFTCDPAARVVNRALAANAELQTLEVQLAKPVAAGEALSATIEGPVSLETDQRIRVPALQLANAGRQRTFVMLPPTAGNLTAEWTLRGLSAEALPANLAAKLGLERSPIAYRVQRERFVAEQRVFPDAMRSAAYRLAESRVAIGPDGAVSILAQLIVQAGGSDNCNVILPAGAEMEYASVDGAVQRRFAGGGEAWPVPVGSRFLPRYLVISYRLPSSKLGKPRRFEPLQVSVDGKPLSPETTLWSIDDALGMKADESAGNLLSATAYAAAARQKQIDAFLDAYPLASQLAEWELQIWRQPWLERLSQGGGAVAAADPPAWVRLRERLANGTPQRGPTAIDPLRQWSRQNGAAADYFSGAADGSVTLAPATPAWPVGRWFAALTLAAAIGVALRRPAALSNFALPAQRWPYAALGIAGGLWWMLLAPSWVGLVLAAFAMAAYWKSRK